MRIDTPAPEPYNVDVYDFTFSNGLFMSFSVAKDLGDSVDFDTSPMAVQFHFSEKPSPTDNDAKLPPEDVTVLMQHVITVQHRTQSITPPSLEQKALFQQTLLAMGKTIQ